MPDHTEISQRGEEEMAGAWGKPRSHSVPLPVWNLSNPRGGKGTCESCWDALKSLEGPRVSAEMAAAPAAALDEAHFGAALADTRA